MVFAATLVMVLLAIGIAGAEKAEKTTGSGAVPVILTDATWTDNIWTVGSSGFFFTPKYAGTA